jgi:tetratricopeptide (TPR) repeat protein
LALARSAGDIRTEGGALNELGILADDRGDVGTASRHYQSSLACHRAAGRLNNEAATLSNLGYLAMAVGHYEEAETQFEAAGALFVALGDQRLLGLTEINLAMARLNQARAQDAAAIAQTALLRVRRSADSWAEATALRVLGLATTLSGQHAAASGLLQSAHDLFMQAGTPHLAAEASAGQAWCALNAGDVAAALTCFDQALALVGVETEATADRLEGTEEPMRIRHIGWAVLVAAADPRADPWLVQSHRHLQIRAERIADPSLRDSFLHRVPFNRSIGQAWAERCSTQVGVLRD